MALPKRKQESEPQFAGVPDPGSLNDSVNEAEVEKHRLTEQHRQLKEREAQVSERLRAWSAGTHKIEGSARDQAHELERLRQELNEIRRELVVVGRAKEEAELAFRTAIGRTSRLVCEKVQPEWDRRVRRCLLATFEAIEAYRAVMDLKDELIQKDIDWLAHLNNIQLHHLVEGLKRKDILNAVNGGIINKAEVPQIVRDRFDI